MPYRWGTDAGEHFGGSAMELSEKELGAVYPVETLAIEFGFAPFPPVRGPAVQIAHRRRDRAAPPAE